MDRRIIRHVAWFIVFAMLLPMAGIAEDPTVYEVAAASVDEVVTVDEAEAIPEEGAELELGTDGDDPVETELETEQDIIEMPAGEDAVDPEAEETPQTEDAPQVEDVIETEDAPQTEEVPQTEEAPQAEDVTETEEAPRAEDATETEEAPEAEDAPQTEDAPEGEPEPAAEPVPAEPQPEAAAATEAAPVAGGEVVVVEEAQSKLAEAAAIPGAIMLGVKEKYQLPPLGDGFATSKKAVATVSPTGLITAKKKGTAVITVTAGGAPIGVCQVVVKAAPKKVSLPKKQQVVSGQSVALAAKVSGAIPAPSPGRAAIPAWPSWTPPAW